MNKETAEPVTVAIVDDDDVFRKGLEALLLDTGIQLVAICSNYEEFVDVIISQPPHVALVDMHFYGWQKSGGIELILKAKQLSPSTKCIVLTGFDPDGNLFPDAYFAGAYGYLRKGHVSGTQLPDMIKTVASGQYVYDAELAKAILTYLKLDKRSDSWRDDQHETHLTRREEEILHLIAQGFDNKEIAKQLVIGVSTVKTHIQNILSKLQFHNREQAALYRAMKNSIKNH